MTGPQDGGNWGGGRGGMESTGGQVLLISGGVLVINAEGDGLDSNGTGSMSGGDVTVYGPTRSGNGALDVGTGLVVTGGTLVAVDSGGMSQNPASGNQAYLSARVNVSTGTTVSVLDSAGTVLSTYTLPKAASTFVYTSDALVAGQSYTLSSAGATLATATAQG